MRKLLLTSTVLAGALIASGAVAQDAQQALDSAATSPQALETTADDSTELGEIIVTGSRIRRSAANAPTPLIQVSQDEILNSGQTSVIDYLATLPALQNSTVPSDTTGSSLNTGGLSLPNLRSLGAGRTLTLVDGRRHVGSSGGELSVDVDTVPRLLIQNVEIITGGASSVYGADAVSGVVNFILKKDFEGLEIDANYGQINDNGEASRRISGLIGKNFLDDRLNLYAHAEYEKIDNVDSMDIDWIRRGPVRLAVDADPTNAPYDGLLDADVFYGVNRLDILPWGQTTLGNLQQPSNLTNPNIPYQDCYRGQAGQDTGGFTYEANCFGITPGKTFVYDGLVGRAADFGQRVGNVGINRPYNIGGDGMPLGEVAGFSRVPASESQRYQVGANFKVTDSINFRAEAKYVTEETFMRGQRTFFDVDLDNGSYAANDTNSIWGTSAFDLRWDDNAFLPQNIKDAIAANRIDVYAPPTAANAGQLIESRALPIARHSFFGPERSQKNTRDIQRYVVGFDGNHGPVGFAKSLSWDIGYTYGKAEIENIERAVDTQRMALAADAVVDTLGVVGSAGSVVCRSQLLQAQGATFIADKHRLNADGDPTNLLDTEYGRNSISECAPLNIFGAGNQSAEALQYVDAAVRVEEMNEQHQAIASMSTELWDFWGAGNLGFAFGGEWRKETTSAIGRSTTGGDRLLFLNTGADFPEVSYESKELFTEVSVPLFRDSRLGEYAELSGSYRWADYSTVGGVDVYGVNLVYRPIRDITFKTSFNTSVRVPNLGENYSPYGQTFANNFADPCATAEIADLDNQETKENRIRNCTALAAQQGLTGIDFAGATATNTDDFDPNYTSGIAGVSGGNPDLQPEESESFTFSTVFQPRFAPGLTLSLDYYEIRIDKVIAAVSAAGIAANCVNGAELNMDACNSVFRNNPDIAFGVGAPSGDPIGGFIERSFNYAALETRGLDFGANYTLDTGDFGKNWGAFDWRLNGSWLIEQKQFLNESDPSDYDELAGSIGLSGTNVYPRVRMSSSLAWRPNDTWNVNWTTDWQSSANIVRLRDFVNNADSRLADQLDTGAFVRHDLTVRYKVREDLTLRAGVVNLFDEEQRDILGTTIYSNYDPYGRRFFVGLNFRPF